MQAEQLAFDMNIIHAFDFDGIVTDIEAPYGEGHINDTMAIRTVSGDGNSRRYIVQQINQNVFPRPDQVMENIHGVTEFLRKKIEAAGGDPHRETLHVVPTKEGSLYYLDAQGNYWRAYDFIEDTITLQQVRRPEDFYGSARTFGRFQLLLGDYPAETLHETIVDFHNTPVRFANFLKAVQAAPDDLRESARAEIDFVLKREDVCSHLVRQIESGELPLRVTHNDTKLNNVLMDPATGEGICVVDLDTVMPGLVAYDFGDAIRFGASTALEDEQDLSKVRLDIGLFDAFAKGYLEVAGSVLTDAEKKSLPWGSLIISLEIGMRFLTDYLSGDVYFKISRPGHNLDRARTQFKLVQEMEDNWEEMLRIVDKYS